MTTTATGDAHHTSSLLDAMLNLTRVHREHEEFYSSAPRERAVTLQRHARTLHALADRWSTVTPSTQPPLSPFAGADDLNDPAALQLEGVLFMEGEGEPAETQRVVRLQSPGLDHLREAERRRVELRGLSFELQLCRGPCELLAGDESIERVVLAHGRDLHAL